ncbi:MAG: anthranilate synthase component I [Cellvibrionales bacterium]|nr:anthranilate synthase component I [Cellvibrionales bacterium]
MHTLTPEHFATLAAQGYNRIPVVRELFADLETPLSCYLKLARQPYSYLLESVQGGEKWGRYSFIGLPCRTQLIVRGNTITVQRDGEVLQHEQCADPLTFIEQFRAQYRVAELPNLPRFTGGLVGFFAYDTVRYVEPHLQKTQPQQDPLGTPDILLLLSEEVLVFDNLSGRILLIVHADTAQENALALAQQRLDTLQTQLATATPALPPIALAAPADAKLEEQFVSSFGETAYKNAVGTIKEFILAGDTMQVVLSQRMSLPFDAEPLNLYRALRSLNPSPYMYFLDCGDFHIAGSSPEILARLEDGAVTVRPIAGTRKRGNSAEEDRALAEDLLADPKEIAEHLMLIDLGRNDVGRIAKTSSVQLTEKMVVELYSHVMHITSNVTGELRDGLDAMDVLRATLPAGTLSGAPKIRAMEIIDQLETEKRGIYGGAIGYLSWSGNMDTAIAIRTAVIKDKKLYIQAGAGIVADSVPQSEWDETMNKGRAVFRAAAMVLAGK